MQANEDACCTPAGLFKSVGVGRSLLKWLRRVSSQGADGQHVQRGRQTREAWRALPLDSASPGSRDGRGPGRPGAMGAAIGASRLPPHASLRPRPLLADKSKAAKAVKKSSFKNSRKPRYSVVFHRPKTLIRAREPKFPRVRCAAERAGRRRGAACSGMRSGGDGREAAGAAAADQTRPGSAGAGQAAGALAEWREQQETGALGALAGRGCAAPSAAGSMSGVALTCHLCCAAAAWFLCCCSAPSLPKLDSHSVIKFPLTTESAMKKIEDNNTLVSPA